MKNASFSSKFAHFDEAPPNGRTDCRRGEQQSIFGSTGGLPFPDETVRAISSARYEASEAPEGASARPT